MFIDTHTHIYTKEFEEDRPQVVERAIEAGAKALLLPAIDESSLPDILKLCSEYPGLCYPMIGIHPTDVPKDYRFALERLEKILQAPHPFVAVGEVGLDYYWDDSKKNEQKEVFSVQIEWALRHDLPLVIHSRSAHADIVEMLAPHADKLRGVFHCFGGTSEEAEELLATFPHFLLGIGGVVTFKKSTLPEVLLGKVPLERIVVETDAPYLAPTPYRGKRNEPAYVPYIVERLALIYNTSREEVEKITTNNAEQLFGLKN